MDRIVETEGGFDIIVGGRRFGSWRTRREAVNARRAEQQRQQEKDAAAIQECILSTARDCGGMEVCRDWWTEAERLVATGKITLGPTRGPGGDWRRAEYVEQEDG